MISYTKQDIEDIYRDFIKSAYKNFYKHRLKDALKDIQTSANWAYNFNHLYTDPEVEQLLKQISESVVDNVYLTCQHSDRCVLIDSFLLDNRGLSQQYLRALMANDMRIMVIYTTAGGIIGKDILSELKAYDKAEIVQFSKDIDQIKETRQIVTTIMRFAPAYILLHLNPWDVVALMSCHAVKGAKIYNINLTDHAYWMGASFIDYNIEFRPYGMTVSLEKRELKKEQVLSLPYYPITPRYVDFDGFPEMPKDAVKVFTGGSLYKMLGKDDIFFRIMECILSIAPNVYILVAGFASNNRFDEKISRINGKERVFQIGVRKDIDAVFEHCDIYLGTYPSSGGLMVQYAAKHAKPVIAYHDKGDVMNAIEEIVNHSGNEYKSTVNLDEMKEYASRLIHDVEFRNSQGNILHDGMMNEQQFNNEFKKVVIHGAPSFKWEKDLIDYDSFYERYLDLENSNGFAATRMLFRDQKIAVFCKVKKKKGKLLMILYKKIKSHIFK